MVTQLSNEHYQFLLDVQSRMSRVIKPVILIFLSGSSFFPIWFDYKVRFDSMQVLAKITVFTFGNS